MDIPKKGYNPDKGSTITDKILGLKNIGDSFVLESGRRNSVYICAQQCGRKIATRNLGEKGNVTVYLTKGN